MMNSILRSTLFIALLALGVASCKSDSDNGTGPGTTVTGVQAKTGSTYTYDSTSSESNTTGSITYTIAADNLAVGSRTGVRLVKQAQDTAFMFAYNTDGSISMFFPGETEGMATAAAWIKLPVKGGAGESLTVIDTTIYDPAFPLPLDFKITMQSSYVGTGSVTVSGKSYAGQNVKLLMTLESNLLGNTTSESTITWVPEIGFYGKMVGNSGAVGSTSTQSETLTSFTLVK
jgi:hypothetical protein